MDSKQYIESGIIERYVLGAVSDQERREVECMCAIYPELKEELLAVQATIESYVESIAVQPPVELKAKIFSAIQQVEQEQTATESSTKVVQLNPVQNTASTDENRTEAKVVSMKPFMKWAVAASIVPIIGFGVLYLSERNSRVDLTNQLAQVQSNTEAQFKDSISNLQNSLTQNKEYQALILDESTEEILLAGTDVSPESQARVFWSQSKEEFMLVSDRLPSPVSGKQYQLWAIADGVPVDLGVLDKASKLSSPRKIQLENIQAFAITLEKDGGSPTPTMDQMYVVGSI